MSKRLILNGFYNKPFQFALEQLYQHPEIDFISTIDQRALLLDPKVETIHHEFEDCLIGRFPVVWKEIAPLEESFVKEMAPLEQIILRMMDRMHPVRFQNYSERKIIYLRQLRYWSDFLSRYHITDFCSANIPHETNDYIIYYLCRKRGIRCTIFSMTALGDRFSVFDTIEDGFLPAQELYAQAMAKNQRAHIQSTVLLELADKMAQEKKIEPFYMKANTKELSDKHSLTFWVRRAFSHLKKTSLKEWTISLPKRLRQARDMFVFVRRDKKLFRKYNMIADDKWQPNGRYVFVPLHFQPELTSNPLGGSYVDQQLVIEMLDYCLPKDVYIVVKEHPFQRSAGRIGEFYENIREYRRVKFVPKYFSSAQLISGATAVATCTGTAGWEALWSFKPVFLFGEIFYQFAPGVYNARTLSSLKTAVSKVFSENAQTWTFEDLKLYIQVIESMTFAGFTDAAYEGQTLVSSLENSNRISETLFTKIFKSS
ncbi:MAG: hypothetical protein EOO45_00110 [Flavobacterium sp.]|nr:MAG: hypothetical protein EOO45_00110 [Flavobacterium sp.]